MKWAVTATLPVLCLIVMSSCGEGGGPGGTSGQGGSTAIFTIAQGHLYILNGISDAEPVQGWQREESDTGWVTTFDLTNKAVPEKIHDAPLSLAFPETIHSDGDRIFVGGEDGMQILTLEDPASPMARGFFSHVRGCDPVVTAGELAYVTIRSVPGRCFSEANELQIVDINQSDNPQIIARYEMSSPWGLAVAHNHAYICDGSMGLTIVNVTEPEKIATTSQIMEDICFDVIAADDLLITTGGGAIRQYRISENEPHPILLSQITAGE